MCSTSSSGITHVTIYYNAMHVRAACAVVVIKIKIRQAYAPDPFRSIRFEDTVSAAGLGLGCDCIIA